MAAKKRVLWIDVFRALCMLWIVGRWHLFEYVDFQFNETVFTCQLTYCILASFTFLSGFLACNNTISNWQEVFSYYKKRIIRIYPLLFLGCFLMVITGWISKIQALKIIFGIGVLTPGFPTTLWFVSMLIVFYLCTPYLLLIKSKYRRFILFLIIEGLFLVMHKVIGADERLFYYWIFYYLGIIVKDNNYLFTTKNSCVWGGGYQLLCLLY